MQNPNWDNINYYETISAIGQISSNRLFVKHMQHFECTVKFVD